MFAARLALATPAAAVPPPSPRRVHCATRSLARPSHRCRAAPGTNDPDLPPPPMDADEALLMEDLRRMSGGGAGRSGGGRDAAARTPLADPPASSSSSAKDLLDKALIADFFFVLAALGWLVTGVGVRAGGGSTALLDSWYGLWPLVFQPAIGALMAGALISGGLGWVRGKQGK